MALTDRLTPREQEIASLVADGKSNRAIADALSLSVRTVESHVQSILQKLDVKTRIELTIALLRKGRATDAVPEAHPSPGSNLPLSLTSFVNRTVESDALTHLLEAVRLVTVTGSGGVGKTRTALHVAESLLDNFPDGVWFVDLSPLARGEYVAGAAAQALRIKLDSASDPAQSIAWQLQSKHALLVFDNCEHVLDSTAHVIETLLALCKKVKVLATSRQSLNIAGERVYRLPSLELPPAERIAGLKASEALTSAAVLLFVERARSADQRFALTDANAPAVGAICNRLDGIPLAIELAASRVTILSPRDLSARLEQNFNVLSRGSRGTLPRQQTVHTLIGWSYDLLDAAEKALFRRLGIFVNGFSLEGALAVGGGAECAVLDVVNVLTALVEKSLVVTESIGESLRYRLLASTRAYALNKLDEAGERSIVAGLHLRYLRDRFQALWEERERTARGKHIASAFRLEFQDVRSALDWALTHSEIVDGATLLANVEWRWRAVDLEAEGTARCEAFLGALPETEFRLLARLEALLAIFYYSANQVSRGFEIAVQAVEHARAGGDTPSLALALNAFAKMAIWYSKLDEARRAIAEAEALPELSVAQRLDLLSPRGLASQYAGDFDGAIQTIEQELQIHRSLGNAQSGWQAAVSLAEAEHARGNTRRAIAIVHETLPDLRVSNNKHTLATLYVNLTGYLVSIDDLTGAFEAGRAALASLERNADDMSTANAIEHLALVFALWSDVQRAAVLDGYAGAALARYGFERSNTETLTHNRLSALLCENLAPDELARLAAEGAALKPELAVALAIGEPIAVPKSAPG